MSFSGSYTTPVKTPDVKQQKRLSCETWWNYSPVNTTEFGVQNIIKFQIPTTDVIFDLSRAFITLDYCLPFAPVSAAANVNGAAIVLNNTDTYNDPPSINNLDAAGNTLNDLSTPAILNAGTIFSTTEMYMDGNLIWHNDYTQAQCRLWQMNKNDQWLDSQPQTFLRTSRPKQDGNMYVDEFQPLIFNHLTLGNENILPSNINSYATAVSKGQRYEIRQLKIPLAMIFPQFEVMNGWPSFLIKQILYLQLTVSDVKRYLVALTHSATAVGGFNVCNINAADFGNINTNCTTNKPVFRYHGSLWTRHPAGAAAADVGPYTNIEFDLEKLLLRNIRLYLPAHIPEFKERAEYESLVNNGLTYGFKYYNILSNSADFRAGQVDNTRSLTFNSSVNNLEAINLLFMQDDTEVVYDKPSIEAIQCNLGNSWMLAASGTHIDNILLRNVNFLTDLCKGWGQQDKPYMQSISHDTIDDINIDRHLANIAINRLARTPANLLTKGVFINGSYTMYFDVSPGDELGVSSASYSRLINLRWANCPTPIDGFTDNVRCQYQVGKIYLCQQTFNTIMITPSGVFIKNPFAEEFNAKTTLMTYANLNYDESGLRTHGFSAPHGFASPHGIGSFFKKAFNVGKNLFTKGKEIYETIQPVITTGRSVYKNVKNLLADKRSYGETKFKVKAMNAMGPEGYRLYQNKINKYALKSYGKKERLKNMKKEWFAKQGADRAVYKEHHGFGKYIPGSHMKRFRNESSGVITPGWRGRLNKRPMRLHPYGRFITSIPVGRGSMDFKHGLAAPYHGLWDGIKRLARRVYNHVVPEKWRKHVEPFKKPVEDLTKSLYDKATGKLKEGIDRKLGPQMSSRLQKTFDSAKKVFKDNGWENDAKKFISKKTGISFGKSYHKAIAGMIDPETLKQFPHMKKINKFYNKHYGNKYAKAALRLERKMWKMGGKRMNDGQY